MAAELTKTSDQRVLAGRLVSYLDAIANASLSVTGVTAGEFFLIKVDNSKNAGPVYLKIADAAAATPGTTHPDWIFYAAAGSISEYAMPFGVPYSVGLTTWCVTGPESTGGNSAASPAYDVVVRIVSS